MYMRWTTFATYDASEEYVRVVFTVGSLAGGKTLTNWSVMRTVLNLRA